MIDKGRLMLEFLISGSPRKGPLDIAEKTRRWICSVIGAVFLVAAAMKAHELGTFPMPDKGFFSSPQGVRQETNHLIPPADRKQRLAQENPSGGGNGKAGRCQGQAGGPRHEHRVLPGLRRRALGHGRRSFGLRDH